MKINKFLICIMALSALLIYACAGTKKTTVANPSTNSPTATNSSTELALGKSIYESNCNSCHGLKTVDHYSSESWKNIVPKMVSMTNKKANKTAIDTANQRMLLNYLLANCKK